MSKKLSYSTLSVDPWVFQRSPCTRITLYADPSVFQNLRFYPVRGWVFQNLGFWKTKNHDIIKNDFLTHFLGFSSDSSSPCQKKLRGVRGSLGFQNKTRGFSKPSLGSSVDLGNFQINLLLLSKIHGQGYYSSGVTKRVTQFYPNPNKADLLLHQL